MDKYTRCLNNMRAAIRDHVANDIITKNVKLFLRLKFDKCMLNDPNTQPYYLCIKKNCPNQRIGVRYTLYRISCWSF